MVTKPTVTLASIVMFVGELARSVAFYSELLAVSPSVQTDSAALLVAPGGCQLYLRAIGDRAAHPLGGVGPQYSLWTASTREELDRCERFLRSGAAHVSATEQDGFRLVEGRDPDDEPVLVTFPGPDKLPRRAIIERIYEW